MDYTTCLNNQCRVFVHGVKYYNKIFFGKPLTIEQIADACFLTKTTINDYMNGSRKPNDFFYQSISALFKMSYDSSKETYIFAQNEYIKFLRCYFNFDYDTAKTIANDFVKKPNLIFSVASTYYLFFSYYLSLIDNNVSKKREFEHLIEKYQLLDESMYLFYLIVKNERKHYYDQFKFDLDTTIKMSVIGLNNTIEEHLLVSYFNLLYCWSVDNKDIHYIAHLIDEFRYNGYYNFYFVLLCKNSIYNLIHGKKYSDYQYEQIKQLCYSLNGKYNVYFFQVLCGFNALLNDDVTTAYQYIEPLTIYRTINQS